MKLSGLISAHHSMTLQGFVQICGMIRLKIPIMVLRTVCCNYTNGLYCYTNGFIVIQLGFIVKQSVMNLVI